MIKRPNWDDIFMTQVYLVALRSTDRNTHIGAVIVNPDNVKVSDGYNGFVRGLRHDVEERHQSPEKYFWMEHAERNAIFNAGRNGISVKGCRMYTNGMPCMDCARAVVQSGITEVIVDGRWDKENSEKWAENAKRSLQMFKELGIGVRYYSGHFVNIHKFRHGKKLSLRQA